MKIEGPSPSLSNKELDPTSHGEATPSVNRAEQGSGNTTKSGEINGETVELFMAGLSQVADVRQERVDELKRAMTQGTYRIDAQEIAGVMLNEVLG